MKTLPKHILAALLAACARGIIRKYRPTVIMVTGSVGKTSTKDAIYAALRERAFVRASAKSQNSEFGMPFTVIGVSNPWRNPAAWARVFKEALALLLLPNHYPTMLVLEVGADRPGDLAKILQIALPDVVVVTRLPEVPVHVEAYPSPEAVREEEFVPAYGLAPGAPLIISSEDTYAAAYAKRLPAHVSTFGFATAADVRVHEAQVCHEHDSLIGMEAELVVDGERHALCVKGALGRTQLLAPAAAIAVARAVGISLLDALKGLESYESPPGRMRLLHGVRDSILIDDTYNSSPAAAEEALTALHGVKGKRHIAVMGDMLELGRFSIEEHDRIGALAAEQSDILVTVGVRARAMAAAARVKGMPEESVISFTAAHEAAAYLHTFVQSGDVVLIKGSQSIRLERLTEALLADPADALHLVRQEKEWKRI